MILLELIVQFKENYSTVDEDISFLEIIQNFWIMEMSEKWKGFNVKCIFGSILAYTNYVIPRRELFNTFKISQFRKILDFDEFLIQSQTIIEFDIQKSHKKISKSQAKSSLSCIILSQIKFLNLFTRKNRNYRNWKCVTDKNRYFCFQMGIPI